MTRPTQPTDRNPMRQEIERLRATRGASAPAMIRKVRAQAAADQFANRQDTEAPLPVRTRHGQVTFNRIEFREISSELSCVEVWVDGDMGPPQYKFFNPPTLAEDSQGDIEIEGQRYREDPMAAIAEVILGSKR